MDLVLTDAAERFTDAINHLKVELSAIRAGKANPSLVENIPVSAYGAEMRLVELGSITVPQPTLLVVTVWDPSIIIDVQKAILEANLGINPNIDGQTVRLPIPPLTEERRLEFVKLSHQKGEQAKVEIRQVRADIRATWEKAAEAKEFGEDELDRREKLLQDMVNNFIGQIDALVKDKEAELTTL